MKYIVEIEIVGNEYVIKIPDDILKQLNLKIYDEIECVYNGDNSYSLIKK